MNKLDVIQTILNQRGANSYLEIGVNRGRCFLPIKARRKIGVDPALKLSSKQKRKYILRNFRSKYYGLTSDEFFSRVAIPFRFDVVFIDGLHTYRQAVRDVENSLAVLNDCGVIVLHDCNPPDAAAAWPADSYEEAKALCLPGWTGEWCGDVWKSICYLRSQRTDLRIFVLDCDYGLGVITKGESDTPLRLTEAELDKLTYEDLGRDRKQLLNLKDEQFLAEFLTTIG